MIVALVVVVAVIFGCVWLFTGSNWQVRQRIRVRWHVRRYHKEFQAALVRANAEMTAGYEPSEFAPPPKDSGQSGVGVVVFIVLAGLLIAGTFMLRTHGVNSCQARGGTPITHSWMSDHNWDVSCIETRIK